MKFEEISKEIIKDLNIEICDNRYAYVYKDSNNNNIGIIIISSDETNILDFYIFDEYQGYKYGEKMLKDALNILKLNGYHRVDFIVDKKEVKKIKIINSLGGQYISTITNQCRYKILL